LEARGYSVACLNGSLGFEERRDVQRTFAHSARILVSTEAGGEGLNLQFCHVIVNYDLPWNPMKIEQRIGRVDRIGQKHIVRAMNFALEGTVELRVREVLPEGVQLCLLRLGKHLQIQQVQSPDGFVPLKDKLVEVLNALLEPIRKRHEHFRQRPDDVMDALREGTRKANAVAEETLHRAKAAMKQDFFRRRLEVE